MSGAPRRNDPPPRVHAQLPANYLGQFRDPSEKLGLQCRHLRQELRVQRRPRSPPPQRRPSLNSQSRQRKRQWRCATRSAPPKPPPTVKR
eukprot:2117026-Pyramimonas_sp.AAC.1